MPTPLPFSTFSISRRIAGSSIVAGIVQGSPCAIFFMAPRRTLPERGLQAGDLDRQPEGRDGSDLLTNKVALMNVRYRA